MSADKPTAETDLVDDHRPGCAKDHGPFDMCAPKPEGPSAGALEIAERFLAYPHGREALAEEIDEHVRREVDSLYKSFCEMERRAEKAEIALGIADAHAAVQTARIEKAEEALGRIKLEHAAALEVAYREGAEAMKEALVQHEEDHDVVWVDGRVEYQWIEPETRGINQRVRTEALRALPIPERKR